MLRINDSLAVSELTSVHIEYHYDNSHGENRYLLRVNRSHTHSSHSTHDEAVVAMNIFLETFDNEII